MSIRLKIILWFSLITLLVGCLGAFAVSRQLATAEMLAVRDAEHVAAILAHAIAHEEPRHPPLYKNQEGLQNYIVELHRVLHRDLEVVDLQKRIIADAIPQGIGKIFTHDANNEVEKTLRDGIPRTFIELSPDYPQGIRQLVVPLETGKQEIVGALLFEYTPLYEEMVGLAKKTIYQVLAISLICLGLSVYLGYLFSRSISIPIRRLKETALEIQQGNLSARAETYDSGEIGDLARTFNKMVRDLAAANHKLLAEIQEREAAEAAVRDGERFLADIFDCLQDGLCILDTELNIRRVNPTMGTWFSHKQPLEGKKCYAAFHEREVPCEICPARQTLETGLAACVVNSPVNSEGQADSWFEIQTYPLLDQATEKIRGVIEYVRDITARKQAEEAVREADDRLSTLVQASPLPIMSLDLDGMVINWNAAAERTFGWRADEVLGRLLPIVPQDHLELFHEMLERVKTHGQGVDGLELKSLHKDGGLLAVNAFTSPLHNAAGEIIGSMGIIEDITARKRAEEELWEATHRLGNLIQASPLPIISADRDGRLTSWNAAAERIFGWRQDEVLGSIPPVVPPEWVDRFYEIHARQMRGEPGVNGLELPVRLKDGAMREIKLFSAPLQSATGEAVGAVSIFEDITDLKRAEAALRQTEDQLRQAQKMEAVGRLAGGVAHDFNNLLTAITGYTELLLLSLEDQPRLSQDVEEIRKAAARAASLTRQLLAFSRKQIIQPKVLDLNEVILNLDKMLRRLINEDIHLATVAAPGLGRVMADPGQVEQVIINLVANARDAMPRGGKLTVETANVELDEDYARGHLEVKPGPYVLLAVSDTGVGLREEIKAHLFEPFFTTKEVGKGTGLGLSTVHGIVKQSGGHISVYSEPGEGTTFKIYLPRINEPAQTKPLPAQIIRQGRETILLVEDEAAVRQVTRRILERHGYCVLEAGQGSEALARAQEFPGPIHLLLTDVVMPEMSGREVADLLTSRYPEAKILYMSGHTENAIVHHGILNPGVAFIQKPYRLDDLVAKVRQILDSPPAVPQ